MPSLINVSPKFYQKAQPLVRQTEISQQLLLMDRSDLLNRFDLDNHSVLNNQIRPEALFELETCLDDGNRYLP
jgi:hypothetical protein